MTVRRTSAEILAEAKKDQQDTPVKEPWVLVLKNGHECTFRDPRNVSIEVADSQTGSLASQLRALLSPRDFRQFWREWGKVEQRYIQALINEVVDYYTDDDAEGNATAS